MMSFCPSLIQAVCITLNHFGGGHFQRVSGYCGNVSTTAAWHAIQRVRDQLAGMKAEYVRLPTQEQSAATARRNLERFHLPGFAYGIDGMLVRFDDAIRGIPVGEGYPLLQNYFSRKMFFALNVLFVCGDDGLIYAFDRDWHGAAHDARIWNTSLFKPEIEGQRRWLLAGDSAFPLTDTLIKPFKTADAIQGSLIFYNFLFIQFSINFWQCCGSGSGSARSRILKSLPDPHGQMSILIREVKKPRN